MIGERIKELVDFATTESPFRSATKGWINDDVYLKLGSSPVKPAKAGTQLANVSVYSKPITEIALIIFVVVSLSTILIFCAVSLSQGRFHINLVNNPAIPKSDSVETFVEKADPEPSVASPMPKSDSVEIFVEKVDLEPSVAIVIPKPDTLDRQLQTGVNQITIPRIDAPGHSNAKKLVTAEDLFRPKQR